MAAHGLVFCVIEKRNHVAPAVRGSLREGGLHLADRLSGEEQTAAGVVEDLVRNLQLPARPGQQFGAGMPMRALGPENFHVRKW